MRASRALGIRLAAAVLVVGCGGGTSGTGTDAGDAGDAGVDAKADDVPDSGRPRPTDAGNDGDADSGRAMDSGPRNPNCGNGELNDGEACDDGNNQSGDGCSNLCTLEEGFNCVVVGAECEECGNGIKESSEVCDDGNRDDGDGCSADCSTVESGFICIRPGDPCDRCGDGNKSNRESCDDGSQCVGGDNDGADCTEDPSICTGDGECRAVSGDGCSADCQVIEENFSCSRTEGGPCIECGNGMVETLPGEDGGVAGEQCDDGNTIGGDGCSGRCTREPNYSCPEAGMPCIRCGDGIKDPREACDDGNYFDNDGCPSDCSEIDDGYFCPIVGDFCIACGNGNVESTGVHKICTGGDNAGTDCTESDALCTGDGAECVVERSCVGGDNEGEDCSTDQDACSGGVCTVVADYTEACDDGRRCDGGDNDGAVCTKNPDVCTGGGVCRTFDNDGCSADCQTLDTGWTCQPAGSPCRLCGDGIRQETEACDDGRQCPDGTPCESDGNCPGAEVGSCAPRDGDGCSADCLVAGDNYTCTEGELCVECGNGVREGVEECDNGSRCVIPAIDEESSDTVTDVDCTGAPELCGEGQVCRPVAGDGCGRRCKNVEEPWSCNEDDDGFSVCTLCGDGVIEGLEVCDDGNRANGDGCSHDCRLREEGYNCFNAGEACVECGNGVVQGDEQCDDGKACGDGTPCDSDDDCASGSCAPRSDDGCSSDCLDIEDGWECPTAGLECRFCGDGVRQETEACDDGNSNGQDGCSNSCTQVDAYYRCEQEGQPCERCGDGVREGSEVCDDGGRCNGTGSICTSDDDCGGTFGSCVPVGNDGCAASCNRIETAFQCEADLGELTTCTRCGDSVVDAPETCDDGNANGGDGCSALCRQEEGYNCYTEGVRCVRCGNGAREQAEECDDSNGSSGDGCSAACTVESSCVGDNAPGTDCTDDPGVCTGGDQCVQWRCPTAGVECGLCGDGIVQAREACDDGNTSNGDGCSSACALEGSQWNCPVAGADCIECGNGVRELLCLDGDAAGASCSTDADCPNGTCGGPEACDDNNRSAGDGCSSSCKSVQRGFQCDVTPGQLSVCTQCGNGTLDRRCIGGDNEGEDCSADDAVCTGGGVCGPEVCDDGNALDGDGCSDLCTTVDAGYNCFDAGQPCVECGNGIKEGDEECDDGNLRPSDGCSSSCTIESVCVGGSEDGLDCSDDGACADGGACMSWDCPLAGVECGLCGDGDVQDVEACDEGSASDNVGCINDCRRVDTHYTCAVGGQECVLCGDGQVDTVMDGATVVYQEECDDDDNLSGDGCSRSCKLESGWTCEEDTSGTTQCALCGNFNVEVIPGTSISEACDDGNQTGGDGCDASCQVQGPYNCPAGGGACQECGNGILQNLEVCDDGNSEDGDGCIDNCTAIDTAGGWTCPVAGSACNRCGDGILQGAEACDDGDTDGNDGCSADCYDIETNYVCPFAGQDCIQCGNGVVESRTDGVTTYTEECDDNNNVTGDGCNRLCFLEGGGFYCDEDGSGRTYCVECGNGTVETTPVITEVCDDSNASSGDGCRGTEGGLEQGCTLIEDNYNCPLPGFSCFQCGNGVKDPGEECDEGELPADGVGCIDNCRAIDTDYLCQAGSECERCGDGIVDSRESCDDGNRTSNDGCDAFCQEEDGYDCSVDDTCVAAECGDGFVAGSEECDDGNDDSGDGCSVLCRVEDGYVCIEGATPHCRQTTCGDGAIEGDEQCDDGDTASSDGCSGTESANSADHCQLEAGYKCPDPGEACTETDCGDGYVEGLEECDPVSDPDDYCDDTACTLNAGGQCGLGARACNGGTNDGNACDTESDCPSGDCSPTGGSCSATTCGDGFREGAEACDDGGEVGGYCVGGSDEGDVCASDADCTGGSCVDGCSTACAVDPLYSCEEDAADQSTCDPIWQFVPIRSFNLTNINPSGLYFDPDTRSFVGYKEQSSQPTIELCLDGTIFCGTGSCSVGGASCVTDADCASGVCQSDNANCLRPADRARPATSGSVKVAGATYNPFGPSYLIVEDGGTVLEVPRGNHCVDGSNDTDPADDQCATDANCATGTCEPWMETVAGSTTTFGEVLDGNLCDSGSNFGQDCSLGCGGGGAKCGIGTPQGVAVGEDGRLYVSDSNELIWVFETDGTQDPGTNNVSFDLATAVDVWDVGTTELNGLWVVPGEGLIGSFGGVTGQNDLKASFWDDGTASLEGRSTVPGPLFPDQTVTFSDFGNGVETATDGGAFIICQASNGNDCQLFARACETDLDCASVVPGTTCNALTQCSASSGNAGENCEFDTDCSLGGTCDPVARCQGGTDAGSACGSDADCGGDGVCDAVRYCGLPGRARDDRSTVATGSTDNVIDVLDNDVRSESSCVSPEFYIAGVDTTGTSGSVSLSDTDGDGLADQVLYTPADGFCGSEDTFVYTAALGGGETDDAQVTVFVSCVCGDGIVQAGEQCDDGYHCVGGGNAGVSCTSDAGICDGSCEQVDDDNCTNACLVNVVCGDDTIGPGEECDDGNTAGGDGCSANCLLESVCGDGVLEGVEECDDGNDVSGDGCQSNCTLPSCGDDVVDVVSYCDGGTTPGAQCTDSSTCGGGTCTSVNEQCDDGGANSNSTVDACRTDCTRPRCGDGVVDTGEQCDETSDTCIQCQIQECGNGELEGSEQCEPPNTATCDDSCRLLPVCPNGILEGTEECDDNNSTNGDGCRADCTLELCGDGRTDSPGEDCDYNDPAYNTDPSEPPYMVCTTQCEVLPVCGNGVQEDGEECDLGLSNSNLADATCRTDCTNAGCGDGVLDTGEQCDDGNTADGDGCSASCASEATCGNNVVEGTEECDDGNTANGDGCRDTSNGLTGCTLEICGDGTTDPQEDCDYADESLDPRRECSFACTILVVCGDGLTDDPEQCDEGDGNSEAPNQACRTDCTQDACGDGVLDDAPDGRSAETCDDGNTVSGDGCDASCQIEPEVCGDGIVNGIEECDDGGQCSVTPASCSGDAGCPDGETCEPQNGDGCRDDCTEEICGDGVRDPQEDCDYAADNGGQTCTFSCTIQPVCGNGFRENGEECDAGAGNAETANAVCRTDCTLSECGDGVTDTAPDGRAAETCDDGNNTSGDGCSASCQTEPDVCGDGRISGDESCDDGNAVSGDGCRGSEDGVPTARRCQPEVCGDGYEDTLRGETCDDGNTVSGDGCSSSCQEEAVCGNGRLETGEQCDDSGYVGSCDTCSPTCTTLSAVCGNGIIEPGEQCDDGTAGTCTAPSSGDGCDVNCQLENSCGDGIVGGEEECDRGVENSDSADALCRTDCTEGGCGDGILDTGEECDDGNSVPDDRCSNTCLDLRTCGDGTYCDNDINLACETDADCDGGTCGPDTDLGEECDDGNNTSGDGCTSACLDETVVCGDDVRHFTEQCDDGNLVNGDGCSDQCLREGDFCGDGIVGTEEGCDNGGQCVGGSNPGADCFAPSDCFGGGTCEHQESPTCRSDCSEPYCGDGIVDPGEQCEPDGACGCNATCEIEAC